MRGRRLGRGHPWLFMLAFGTLAAAVWEGDLVVAGLMLALCIGALMR